MLLKAQCSRTQLSHSGWWVLKSNYTDFRWIVGLCFTFYFFIVTNTYIIECRPLPSTWLRFCHVKAYTSNLHKRTWWCIVRIVHGMSAKRTYRYTHIVVEAPCQSPAHGASLVELCLGHLGYLEEKWHTALANRERETERGGGGMHSNMYPNTNHAHTNMYPNEDIVYYEYDTNLRFGSGVNMEYILV